jgi:hypothetical protein
MNKPRLLTLAFLLALSGFGSAYAQAPALAAGTYKLTIGSKSPCDVVIAADGDMTPAADCATGPTVTKWVAAVGNGYKLLTADGEVYAVLKPQGEALEGMTFVDQHKLVLSH